MRVYPAPADGLADAMLLSGAMTWKMAGAGMPRGGGKAVLAVPELPTGEPRKRLLRRYGELVASLGGSDLNRGRHEHLAGGSRRGRRDVPLGLRDDRPRRKQRPRHRPRCAARDPRDGRARLRHARARRPYRARPGCRLGRRRARARTGRRRRARPCQRRRRSTGSRNRLRDRSAGARARDGGGRLLALRRAAAHSVRSRSHGSPAARSPAARTISSPSPGPPSSCASGASSTRPTTSSTQAESSSSSASRTRAGTRPSWRRGFRESATRCEGSSPRPRPKTSRPPKRPTGSSAGVWTERVPEPGTVPPRRVSRFRRVAGGMSMRARRAARAFRAGEYGYHLALLEEDGFHVAYRKGTADERVFKHSFGRDISFPAFPSTTRARRTRSSRSARTSGRSPCS